MMSQLQPQLSHFNTEKLIASESCDRYYNFIENSGLSNTDYMKKKHEFTWIMHTCYCFADVNNYL